MRLFVCLYCLPVLLYDVRPMNEIVTHEKDGIVIPAYDKQKWAKSMIRLMKNQEIAQQMGQEGKKKLEFIFNYDSMLAKVESMYQEVISKDKIKIQMN